MLGFLGIAKDTQSIAETGQKFGNALAAAGSKSNEKKITDSLIKSWAGNESSDSIDASEFNKNVVTGIVVLLIILLIIIAIWQA